MEWKKTKDHPIIEITHHDDEGIDFDILETGMLIMRILTRGGVFYCVGHVGKDGWLKDSLGDDIGYPADDVIHWLPMPEIEWK